MLITVKDVNGSYGLASTAFLEYLIETGKITAFKGSGGWVEVGRKVFRADKL